MSRKNIKLRAALAAGCLLGAAFAFAGPAAAATPIGSCLPSGTILHAGQSLSSGGYQLIMQSDGKLVEYDSAWHPLWASQTAGNPGAWAVDQGSDGNFVVYTSSGRPLWAAYVTNAPGDMVCMQGDGNVVMYKSGVALWATMTGPNFPRGNTSGGNYYPYGQCTWWAESQAAKYAGVYPRIGGDARYWAANAAANGWHVDSTPHIGSVAVFQPGVDGAGWYGHVAWVTEVYPSRNAITITEMNYRGLGVVDTRTIAPAFGVAGLRYIAFTP